MTRPSTTEAARRRAPREQQPNVRASSSDSDPLHSRAKADKSPRLAEGRSARGAQSNPSNQKKLGTRIADLESQLGLAQEELKCLKDHLASTETAKKVAQDQLEKKPKKQYKVSEPPVVEEKLPDSVGTQILKDDMVVDCEASEDVQHETDVFEVSIEKVAVEPNPELKLLADNDEFEPDPLGISPAVSEAQNPSIHELVSEPQNPLTHELELKNNDEINLLKANLSDRDKELDVIREESVSLKSQLDEKSLKLSSTQSEVDGLNSRLSKVVQELEESKCNVVQLNEKLQAANQAREELENEMTKLRVQTEQWRKAADAAASVLAGGAAESHGRRISERCGSMDTSLFERLGGFASYVGSPGLNDDPDYAFGSEKRKGSGIRMLGELWRKKGQK